MNPKPKLDDVYTVFQRYHLTCTQGFRDGRNLPIIMANAIAQLRSDLTRLGLEEYIDWEIE
jgi:hypothetical protein